MKKILLIEDEDLYANILKEKLKNDFEVIHVYDCLCGIKKLEEVNDISLIITDWMVPKMDGGKFSCLVKLNKKYSSIPIIILTGRKIPDTEMKAKRVNVNLIFYKQDVDWDEFIKKIKELVKNG
jgi:PleD family two-component response regulator